MNRSRRRTSDRGPDPSRLSGRALLARSDEQLVDLVLDGHDNAFEVLFERHVADSLWYAREVLGSWGEAEEAVRHSFAAAHAYLETRGRETEFAPWLHTILGNHCLSMLQARTPGPKTAGADANVVDLGEWRLRRKLFGIALPVAPSAALRDGVMAACGIGGTGAAATGTPLFGGALAKLAVVALLAGGVGVTGNVAPDRAAPAGAQVAVGPAIDAVGLSSTVDASSSREVAPDTGGLRAPTAGEPKAAPDATDVVARSPRHEPPAGPSPVDAPAAGSAPASVPSLDSSATAQVPVLVSPPSAESTLRKVVDVVRTHVPVTTDPVTTRLPGSVELSKIGDDLGVTSVESPVDVRALLSQGVDVPPAE